MPNDAIDSLSSNELTLEELQMDTRPPAWRKHRDTFQTAGALRSAATDLCFALKDTPHHDLAAQIHDSLVMALPRGSHVPIGRAAHETSDRPAPGLTCGCIEHTNGLGGVTRVWCGKHWSERHAQKAAVIHNPDCVKENARIDGRDRWYMLDCDCGTDKNG